MIKQKKQNKFILFICSIMLCFCSVFTLFNNSIGTTYAASPSATAPTITLDYFDYTQSNYLSTYFTDNDFDNGGNPRTTGIFTNLVDVYNEDLYGVSTTYLIFDTSFNINFTSNSLYTIYNIYLLDYSNNINILSSKPSFASVSGTTNVHLGFASSILTSLYDLLSCKHFIVVYYTGFNATNFRVACSPSLYNAYVDYNNGISTGATSGYTDGQNSVINNPSQFGLYTQTDINNAITQGQNNVINNPNSYGLYTQEQYSQASLSGYTTGYNDGYNAGITQGQNNVINNPSDYGLFTQTDINNAITQGQNNVINNPSDYGLFTQTDINNAITQGQNNVVNNPSQFGLYTLEDMNSNYQNGVQAGITQGQNNVINNPNAYGLYTLEQYEENYDLGYSNGYGDGSKLQYGVFSSVDFGGQLAIIPKNATDITDALILYDISNDSFNFLYNSITPKTAFVNAYNDFFDIYNNLSNKSDYLISARLYIDNLNFVYDKSMKFNFFNLNTINEISNYYFYADIILKDANDTHFNIVYKPIVNEGSTDILTVDVIDYTDYNYLQGQFVEEIQYNFLTPPPVYEDSYPILTRMPFSSFMLFENNAVYQNGYDKGYADGTSSSIVTESYDKGYTDGNRVGYQQGLSNGLANANDYTFFGLIGAVIDAPIQYLTSLFNFNILGFNMWAFFTSLITAVFVIWIIRLILGGK